MDKDTLKRVVLLFSVFLFLKPATSLLSQEQADTTVYLITCAPGTPVYSIYGHSALRIVIPENDRDLVYNWGVFDFSTSYFAWKFAKGRLDYILYVEPLDSFLQEYISEQRAVYLQKINMKPDEIRNLMALISDNLKPENIKYRYDFFYDDCSTRIRDIIEKSIGKSLAYPPPETGKMPTFRDKVSEYQRVYPWLKFGVDLIMGSTADKKASFRDAMFLPFDLQNGLSQAMVNRDGKMGHLLDNPEKILDFPPAAFKIPILLTPLFVFTTILVIVIVLSTISLKRKWTNAMDIVLFLIFSVLAGLMVFFNFFSDHLQMKWNLNIIWLNPLIILCLISILLNKAWLTWFRIVFFLASAILLFSLVLPQTLNSAFVPLILLLMLRSSVRSGFSWNPLSLSSK